MTDLQIQGYLLLESTTGLDPEVISSISKMCCILLLVSLCVSLFGKCPGLEGLQSLRESVTRKKNEDVSAYIRLRFI